MKKTIYGRILTLGAATLMLAACSHDDGQIKIQLPEDYSEKTLIVSHIQMDNIFSAQKQEDLKIAYDTLQVKDGMATMKVDPTGAAWYSIQPPTMTLRQPEFYASPGESLDIVISDFDPLAMTVTGTPLMEDMTRFLNITQPIQQEFVDLMAKSDSISPDVMKANMDKYDAAIRKFVEDNPKSPVVPFAIVNLSGDDFKKLYDNMSAEAKKSILMPYAELNNREVEKMLKERNAEEERNAEVASGTITAPDFTLPDLEGKKVSLSSFRGKWVVLDFWGSWCGWCVKGFPALKEAYKKYGDKITIIGIDCNESEADWRAGVKEHALPWLQLYNGKDRSLYEAYNIEGFPTKAIINPEGKLVDLTTGEDPSFFDRLASFVK